jgi:hypothetical protein
MMQEGMAHGDGSVVSESGVLTSQPWMSRYTTDMFRNNLHVLFLQAELLGDGLPQFMHRLVCASFLYSGCNLC